MSVRDWEHCYGNCREVGVGVRPSHFMSSTSPPHQFDLFVCLDGSENMKSCSVQNVHDGAIWCLICCFLRTVSNYVSPSSSYWGQYVSSTIFPKTFSESTDLNTSTSDLRPSPSSFRLIPTVTEREMSNFRFISTRLFSQNEPDGVILVQCCTSMPRESYT